MVHNTNVSDLRALIKEGGLHNPCIVGLRSICWKASDLQIPQTRAPLTVRLLQAFLLFRSLEKSAWAKTLSDSRSAYVSLKEHFLKDIENPDDLSAEDPLTDTETVSHTVLQF